MALSIGTIALPVASGIDTRSDEKVVPPTKFLDLQNVTFDRLGALKKRNGYRALSMAIQDSSDVLADARGMATRDDEILVFTDKRAYSYRPSADAWSDTGEVAATTATTLPIARTGSYQTQPDVAERSGVRVAAWEDSRGGVWCQVSEASTGHAIQAQVQLDSSTFARNPRCTWSGNTLLVIWTREDVGRLMIATVSTSQPSVAPSVAILVNDLDGANPYFDAENAPNGPAGIFGSRPALIAWARTTGITVAYVSAGGMLASGLDGLPSPFQYADGATDGIAVTYDGVTRHVAVVWIDGGGTTLRARFIDASALNVTTRMVSALGSGGVTYTKITAAFGGAGADGNPQLYWAAEIAASRTDLSRIDSGAAVLTTTALDALSTRLRGHGLVSRAWHDGATLDGSAADGDAYVMIAHTVRFFPYVAALRLSDTSGISTPGNTIVARLMPGESAGANLRTTGAGTRAWTRSLPSVAPINLGDANIFTREHAAPLPYRIQLSSQNGDQFSEQGIKLATLNMRPSYQTAQLGRSLYLASAAPMHYDGAAWHEADFHCAPDFGYDLTGNPVNLSTTVAVGTAGAIPNGTYLYAYWYEVVDVQGELHRGPVSVKILATMTGGPRKFNITLPTCRLTNFTNVRICVARSTQGATGTDSSIPLFKVTSNDVTVTTGDNRYVTNDPNVDTVSFVDNLTDAQLQLREPLYTNGGILSNAPAPWGGGIIATGKGRLFWTDSTDPHMIRFSQQRADDTALEAPVDLSLRKDEFGGAITAIAVMDDAVFPFTSTAAFVFGGPGPLADPSVSPDANAFTPVDLVTTDVGCVEVSSVGVTPIGIAFKSAKGIMLLARDRTIVNIGDDVQGFDSQNVVRTTLRSTAQRVMFLTDAGRTLMWDYHQNAWSTFTNHEGLDAVEIDGIYYYLRTNSVVYAETPGVFRDNDEHVAIHIETAWIHFASQLQGWQRILYAYFLGTFLSPHTLSVRFRIDYNSTYSAPILSDVNSNFSPSLYGTGIYGAGVYGGPIGGSQRYQRAIHINKRSQSISFVIEDIEGGDDFGASFELSEILLVGGGLGPAFRVGAARLA